MGDALQRTGVIDSSTAFQQVATSAGFAGGYVAGRYDFVENSTPREALDTLRGGPRRIVPDLKLLLPPGLTLGQIAERVGKLEGKSAQAFLAAAASGTVRSKYEPPLVNSLEGPHVARHVLHRRQRRRGADPPEDRHPVRRQGRRPRPRRIGSGQRRASRRTRRSSPRR